MLIMAMSDKGYFVEQPVYSADVTKWKYIMSQDQVYILAFTLSYM